MTNLNGYHKVHKCVTEFGMEAVLMYLIQRCRDTNCEDAYILRLIADLETTLANYRNRHEDEE